MPIKKREFNEDTEVRRTIHIPLKISRVLDKSYGKTPAGQDARDEFLINLIEDAHANHDVGELSEDRASNPLAKLLAKNIEATATDRKISRNAAYDLEVAALTTHAEARYKRTTSTVVA